uniref:Uncharacterized protein n=1 Tax=Caenorhabditis japonica TaxID=281687 RepID=A0A8R1E8Y0_CAEJA
MGRTHNAKKRWQMDEACARMVSHRREATRWKTTDEMVRLPTEGNIIIRQGPNGLESCDPRPHQVIEELID